MLYASVLYIKMVLYHSITNQTKEDFHMKEMLYTIPLNDAINANDECPFCYIQRKVEQDTMDFVLGSCASYMESDIRDLTDKFGFCKPHFKKMFDYGNTLGNAWILKTHYKKTLQEMQGKFKHFSPKKSGGLFGKKADGGNSIVSWIRERENSCYICKQFNDTYKRYLETFFHLYENDTEFVAKVKNSKGFCMTHFADLLEQADASLSEKKLDSFYDTVLPLMETNMQRLFEDVSWMVEKFDYKNKDADWKNSRDAIQRGMQKLKSGYPADGPYKMPK